MLRAYKGVLPRVAAGAYVDESAQVIGDVEIGEESSLWMNVVVRGDVHWIKIGRRSNVQDGTIVHVMRQTHPTTIGDEVTIGHGAIVHGCTIHDRVLIGMGAIVLNGAVIGSDSIVAAGALVPEGMEVPARSLVMGSPGKVRRTVTDEEVASIAWYAGNYVKYRLDYLPPEGGSHPPEGGSHPPDSGSRAPEGGSHAADSGSRAPDGGSHAHDGGSHAPGSGSRA